MKMLNKLVCKLNFHIKFDKKWPINNGNTVTLNFINHGLPILISIIRGPFGNKIYENTKNI